MSNLKPRIRLPRSANVGDTVEVKTLISHNMESGQRRDGSGNVIPRQIINRFTCEYAGKMVIDAALLPAISANPYIEFDVKIEGSGDFVFTWYDDNGSVYTETQAFTAG